MGLFTPTEEPVACPACIAGMPANLNGSMTMAPFGTKNFTFIQDGIDPSKYLALIVPAFGGIGQVRAWFCEVSGRMRFLVGAAMDPAEIEGNHCDLPVEGTTLLGWFVRAWE